MLRLHDTLYSDHLELSLLPDGPENTVSISFILERNGNDKYLGANWYSVRDHQRFAGRFIPEHENCLQYGGRA